MSKDSKREKTVAILDLNDRLIDFINTVNLQEATTEEIKEKFIEEFKYDSGSNIRKAILRALSIFKRFSNSKTKEFLNALDGKCKNLKQNDDGCIKEFTNFINTDLTNKINELKNKKGASMSLLNGKLTELCKLLSGKNL